MNGSTNALTRRPDLLATVAAGLGLTAVIAFGDETLWWQCPIRHITGFLCPGCGMQSAISSLLSGDLVGALTANPTIVAGPLFLVSTLLVQRTRNELAKKALIFAAIAYVTGLTLLRNI
jgi:hypothetical protein